MTALFSNSLCHICGADHAQYHYGALSCVSCKIFFRRNSQFDLNTNQCAFNQTCQVTISSRRICRYCRLKKCFEVNMQRELLRSAHSQKHRKKRMKNSIAIKYTIQPLDLLENDRSLLTTEQWSYLSNVIHLYDEMTPIFHVRNLIKEEFPFPLKVRCKMAVNNMLTIVSTMHEAILPFTHQISQFKSLSFNDQAALIERNIKSLGSFSSIVIGRETDFCSSSTFRIGFSSVYGSELMDDVVKINSRADNDSTLIKLLLAVLIFSMTSDLYLENGCTLAQYRSLSNTKYILSIQNFYIEILFKYMIYRYGYKEAALRFAGLIKSALDQSMCALRTSHIRKYEELIEDVVNQTEQSLSLNLETNTQTA